MKISINFNTFFPVASNGDKSYSYEQYDNFLLMRFNFSLLTPAGTWYVANDKALLAEFIQLHGTHILEIDNN